MEAPHLSSKTFSWPVSVALPRQLHKMNRFQVHQAVTDGSMSTSRLGSQKYAYEWSKPANGSTVYWTSSLFSSFRCFPFSSHSCDAFCNYLYYLSFFVIFFLSALIIFIYFSFFFLLPSFIHISLCRFRGSHGGVYKDGCLPGCSAV
jgi:hypothetical protein